MKKLAIHTLILGACLFALNASADGDAAAGKSKAAVCGACHGVDGNSMSAQFPKLAGQNASYIAEQLADFKSGKRTNPIDPASSPVAPGSVFSRRASSDVASAASAMLRAISSSPPSR